MIRRPHTMAFAAGVWVFPGGRVDKSDGPGLRGAQIAALRELFEEVGLLKAHYPGQSQDVGETVRRRLDRAARAQLLADRLSFNTALRRRGLVIRPRALIPLAHWITPKPVPRRFDTLFFICQAPRRQIPRPDPYEVAAMAWLRPRDALAAWEGEEMALMFPTRLILQKLAQAPNLAAALTLARNTAVVPVMPSIELSSGTRRVLIPEAAGYGVTQASHKDAEMRMGR